MEGKLRRMAEERDRRYIKRKKLLEARLEKMGIEIVKMTQREELWAKKVTGALMEISGKKNPNRKAIKESKILAQQYLNDLEHIQAQKRKILRSVDRLNIAAGGIGHLRVNAPSWSFLEKEIELKKGRMNAFLKKIEEWERRNPQEKW